MRYPSCTISGRRALALVPVLLSLVAAAAHGETTPVADLAPPVAEVTRAEVPAAYRERLLNEDTTWRGEVVVEGTVSIAPQATLRIEPGTVVRFRGGTSSPGLLMVQGRLVAAGTPEAPILFTGAGAKPQPGEWQGVILLGTEKKNSIENCRIEGAASALEVLYSTASLKKVAITSSRSGGIFQDSFVTMEGCSVTDSGTALQLRESEVEMYRVTFSRNRQGVSARGGSLYLTGAELSGNTATALAANGARLKLSGGTVTDNGSGILLYGSEGLLTGFKFSGNGEVALSLGASRMRVTGNEIARNLGTGLRVEDGAAVAWGNSILENGGHDLYNAGIEEFRAPGNWWGGVQPKIYDNGGRGAVLLAPMLGARPQL